MLIGDFLNEYIGVYEPVTYEVTNVVPLGDGTFETIKDTIIPSGLSGVDWPYILSFVLFICISYFWFRFASAFFKVLINSVKSIIPTRR